MKQMTCAQIGGPDTCMTVISGNSAEEMVNNGMVHIKSDHQELAEKVSKMTPEETTKWMDDFKVKFDALPDTQ